MNTVLSSNWPEYVTCLREWDTRASVRVTPMHKFETDASGRLFSADLILIEKHPLVAGSSDQTRSIIEAHKLYGYLSFTETLERRAVIPVCNDLAEGLSPVNVPEELRRDASKIVVDEAHHAECAAELISGVMHVTGEKPARDTPSFIRKLALAEERATELARPFVRVCFACVSETLITGTLARVPADKSVDPVVRAVIRDHALDEARHHACFSAVIRYLWEGLSVPERDSVGPLLAEFVELFLTPDFAAELGWLKAAGYNEADAAKIVEETYDSVDLAEHYRRQAKPTTRLLDRFGIFEHPGTLDAFSLRKLL